MTKLRQNSWRVYTREYRRVKARVRHCAEPNSKWCTTNSGPNRITGRLSDYRGNTGRALIYGVPLMVARGAGRTVTAEAFGKFLHWLSENDEVALREYQSIRMKMKLVRYFIHKGCSDPDDLFDKTVDVVVGKIDSCGECPSPLAYCFGVAKNIWRQDLRERKSAALEENMTLPVYPDAQVHEQELKCLER